MDRPLGKCILSADSSSAIPESIYNRFFLLQNEDPDTLVSQAFNVATTNGTFFSLSTDAFQGKFITYQDYLKVYIRRFSENWIHLRKKEPFRNRHLLQVATGSGLGIKTVALVTQMDAPIGRAVGNALEVAESVLCLQNKGPDDLLDLVAEIGRPRLILKKTVSLSINHLWISVCFCRTLSGFFSFNAEATTSITEALCDPTQECTLIGTPAPKLITMESSGHVLHCILMRGNRDIRELKIQWITLL